MANLTPSASFDDVLQLETTTVALGGAGAAMNVQPQALLNRTQYLYVHLNALAAVASTGDYNNLINRPALGSAAFQNSVAFATAAQGAKADGAAQASSLATVATSGSYADLSGKPFAADAPSDGNQYGRKNGSWVVVTGGVGGVSSLNSLTGALNITAGSNVVVTASGSSVIVSSTSGGYDVGGIIDPTTTDLDMIIRKVTSITALGMGFIGDSITAGTLVTTAPPIPCDTALSLGAVTVTPTNNGVSGSTSAMWVPGQSNYTTAKAAFISAGVRVVHIMLGTNDAKTAVATTQAQYRANILSTADDLIAAGMLVVLSYPPYLAATTGVFDAGSPARVASYCAAIDSLIDNNHIFRGDAQAYAYFQANPSALQGDGVHPTQTGSDYLAGLWAKVMHGVVNGLTNSKVFQRVVIGSGLTLAQVSGVWTLTASGGTSGQLNGISDQSGTTYTLVLTDAGKDVRCTNSAGITVTIPPNSSVAFPIGTWLLFSQGGAGVVSAAAGAGVTLRSPNGAVTSAIYDVRGLEKTDTDTWRCI